MLTFVVGRGSALLLLKLKGMTRRLDQEEVHFNSEAIRNWGQLVDLLLHSSTNIGITFG